jgi:hypothetical protein
VSVRLVLVGAAAAIALASLGFALGRHGDRTGRQVRITGTVTHEAAPRSLRGDGSLVPAAIRSRTGPRAAELEGAWTLAHARPVVMLLYWSRPPVRRGAEWGTSVLEVWRQAESGWTRLFAHRRPGWIRFDVQTGDVTQDGISDALVTESNGGTGYCGDRLLLSAQDDRVYELFRRGYCELRPTIVEGILVATEPIGECPPKHQGAHCHGGERTQILEWNGQKRVIDYTHVRCSFGLSPERLCRSGT